MTAPQDAPAPATVVIAVEVPDGLEGTYVDWQTRVNRAASKFQGFVAAEIVPPAPGIQRAWTCIYRFSTPAELNAWLESSSRRDFLAEANGRFEEARQFAIGGGAADRGCTLLASHHVKPAAEAAFLDLQHEFAAAQKQFPGFSGQEIFPPVEGVSEEWTSLVRFGTAEELRHWLDSEERAGLVARLDAVVDSYETDLLGTAFGSWFSFTMEDGRATPNWKQWLTVLLVLYPTVMLLGLVTTYLPGGAASSGFPSSEWFFLNMALGNFASTLLLTYVLMPPATRLLAFWLKPSAPRKVTIAGLALVIALFAVATAVFGLGCPGGCS